MLYTVTLENIRVVCGRNTGSVLFAFNGADYNVPMFWHGQSFWLPVPPDSDSTRAKRNAAVRMQCVFDLFDLSPVLIENIRQEFSYLAVEASNNGGGVYFGETTVNRCTFNDDEYFLKQCR